MPREVAARRGLPRPRTRRPYGGAKAGVGRLPIPYTAGYEARRQTGLAVLNSERSHECAKNRLCIVCGLALDKRFWILWKTDSHAEPNEYMEGGMHPKCAKITAHFCPHIKYGLLDRHLKMLTVSWREAFTPGDTCAMTPERARAKRNMYTPKRG